MVLQKEMQKNTNHCMRNSISKLDIIAVMKNMLSKKSTLHVISYMETFHHTRETF